MGYAHEYADAIMHRARVPMEPLGFNPDWADRPRKWKFYEGADTVPLPEGDSPGDATLQKGVFGERGSRPFTLPLLGGMLLDSYGLVDRRLGVQANTDLPALPSYPQANFSRGTASGGGLYPVSVYWVSGARGPLLPGVHHYAMAQHAMQRLLTGDVTGEVREALGGAADDADQFLVLGIKYWQNSFKYNSFSFHAISMDIGTIVQTWRIWARARGLAVEPVMWFDEPRLARLLGVNGDGPGEQEGVFAVVPLRWADHGPAASGSAARPSPATGRAPRTSAVPRRDTGASRRILTFESLTRMHAATVSGAADRPAPGTLDAAAVPPPAPGPAAPVALPAARPLRTTVRTALRQRRSSFGRFDAGRPVTREQLATQLAATHAGSHLDSDVTADRPRLAKLYAFVNHVEGLAPGSYAYDPEAHALCPVKQGPPGAFLQRNYFLTNYNLEQAAVVLVPTVRTTAVLDAVGDRGYRLVGAVVGAVSQTFYTVASALGLGAGVALGFDNISYIEELGIEDTGEAPLLIMPFGYERPRPANFRHEIV